MGMLFGVVVALLLVSEGVAGQDTIVTTAVRVAAIRHMLPDLGPGPVKVDPVDVDISGHMIRGISSGHVPGVSRMPDRARTTRENQAIEAATGVSMAPAPQVVSCQSGRPPFCQVSGASAFLVLGAPRIEGDRATISMQIIQAASRAGRLSVRDLAITLERQGADWRVVESKLIRIT